MTTKDSERLVTKKGNDQSKEKIFNRRYCNTYVKINRIIYCLKCYELNKY